MFFSRSSRLPSESFPSLSSSSSIGSTGSGVVFYWALWPKNAACIHEASELSIHFGGSGVLFLLKDGKNFEVFCGMGLKLEIEANALLF